jgi:hypothetical protein
VADERMTTGRRPEWLRAHVLFAVLALLGFTLVSATLLPDLRHPILGVGDVNLWGYQGYYVAHNFRLLPLPHLDLVNDQTLYPLGTNQLFQPWAVEREIFQAALLRLFGPGPWLQLYLLFSLAVTMLGVYLLLLEEEGRARAAGVAFAITFCSFGALWRFPGQAGMAFLHWTTLGLVADFLLARRLWDRRVWPGRLLLARVALLLLALGLDVGYIAGISIVSFVLTVSWAVAVDWVRAGGGWTLGWSRLRGWSSGLREDLRGHRGTAIALAAAGAWALGIYVPVVGQIALAARSFDFSNFQDALWWASPARLLLPILPGVDPGWVGRLVGDSPEGTLVAQPGLAIVLVGAAGLWASRHRLGAVAPLLALFCGLLALNETTLRWFRLVPWFSFVRVGGRFSLVYPTVLCLLALGLPRQGWKGRRMLAAGALLALLAAEAVTAYSGPLRRRPAFVPDAAFETFMSAVRAAPGEAVLEWPFCIAAGNGVATGELCPYYLRQAGISALRQFHGKKVVGHYFGRLHPDQVEPFLEAGWQHLFVPNGRPLTWSATRQRRDLLEPESRFLADFFLLNDFCGMIVYADLLPAESVRRLHDLVGPPVAEITYPGVGRMEFLPKRPAQRAALDRARGRALRFEPVTLEPALDLDLTSRDADHFLAAGWAGPEKKFRWTDGHRAEVRFSLAEPTSLLLELRTGGRGRQRLQVTVNGSPVAELAIENAMADYSVTIPAAAVARDNLLVLGLPDAHSPASVGAGADGRILGASVRRIAIFRVLQRAREGNDGDSGSAVLRPVE